MLCIFIISDSKYQIPNFTLQFASSLSIWNLESEIKTQAVSRLDTL